MIHVDTKQLARFERVGHRITGDRRQGCSRGAGYEKVHVAVDDATRLAYVEVLPDEQKASTVGFLTRAVGWFSQQGITCRHVLSTMAPPIALANGQRTAAPWISSPSAPSPTHPGRTARLSDSSRPCSASGRSHAVPDLRGAGIAGCPANWGSITAAGATWLSVASAPSSASNGCWSLNDLVRKHT